MRRADPPAGWPPGDAAPAGTRLDPLAAWESIRALLRMESAPGVFESWLRPLSFQALDGATARLAVPTHFLADYVATHFLDRLRALWTALEVGRMRSIELAALYTRIGSDAETFKQGQERFASGNRPKWRLR